MLSQNFTIATVTRGLPESVLKRAWGRKVGAGTIGVECNDRFCGGDRSASRACFTIEHLINYLSCWYLTLIARNLTKEGKIHIFVVTSYKKYWKTKRVFQLSSNIQEKIVGRRSRVNPHGSCVISFFFIIY